MEGTAADRYGKYVEGSLVGSRLYKAFVPPPLPPAPPLDFGPLYNSIDQATQELARLDGLARLLPDTGPFLYLYVRKEAVLSSQIEGTQSSLSDLLLFENDELPSVPLDDVQEVSNYVAALNFGLDQLQAGRPICLSLLNDIHRILLREGRGSSRDPGNFRRVQNWLGGSSPVNATFVPPPPDEVSGLMSNLLLFVHDEDVQMPLLVRAAVAHVQFETIHPYLDGNGRLSRLLITLMLCEKGALTAPLLYLSLYFKTYRPEYYERLMRVRTHGEWERWIDFFLDGVRETAQQASYAATEIMALFERDQRKIEELGRPAATALRVHEYLQRRILLSVPVCAQKLAISSPTVRKAVEHLEGLAVVREISGKQRGRTYLYGEYLKILEQGTEPIQKE